MGHSVFFTVYHSLLSKCCKSSMHQTVSIFSFQYENIKKRKFLHMDRVQVHYLTPLGLDKTVNILNHHTLTRIPPNLLSGCCKISPDICIKKILWVPLLTAALVFLGRCRGLMVSALVSEQSGFKPWPGTLCCVLGQNT